MISIEQLIGKSEGHIDPHQLVHRDALGAFLRLRAQGAEQGFELAIASGYRSFERQLGIWNQKAEGKRPILGGGGTVLPRQTLSDEEAVFAILRWSALPGASRHHWGTEMDVFDAASVKNGYKVQLTLSETEGNGVFAKFHQWLDQQLSDRDCPFFRPYTRLQGGVAPEPWHLSYAPTACEFQRLLSVDQLREVVTHSPIALKTVVLAHLDEIYERFVWVPWYLYPEQWRSC